MVKIGQGALLAAVLAASTGCVHDDDSTQVTVALTTETAIPTELNQFTLNVTDALGSVRTDLTYDVMTQSFFPQTLSVFPQDEDSLNAPFQVSVEGQLGDTPVVLRNATVSYVSGRTLLLPMALRMSCFGVLGCETGESCVGGQCVSPTVDSNSLLDYSDALVFPADAPSCFDESKCLDPSNKAPATFEGDGCTFPLPTGNFNVAIQWDAAPDRAIALQANDPHEGWTQIASDTGQLAAGICAAKNAAAGVLNRARTVYLYPGCPAKTDKIPYCGAGIGQPL